MRNILDGIARRIHRFAPKWEKEIRFVVAGIPGRIGYFSVYVLFTEIGFHYLVSSCFAFFIYWISNFTLVRAWVFESTESAWRKVLPHLSFHILCQTMAMIGLFVLVGTYNVYYVYAQLFIGALYGVANYFFSKKIFGGKDAKK